METILAIGGGGFQMEEAPSPIDDYLLRLTDRPVPRICLLATPKGDSPPLIERFYTAFRPRQCQPSHLVFFSDSPTLAGISAQSWREHLLNQDAIFVSGGNARAALALRREWHLEAVLKEAWNSGIVLAGMSAGAMCWFEFALTDTYWDDGYRPVPGLGLLPGGCRVHYDDSQEQRGRLHEALRTGAVPPTIAIGDHAAVLFEGTSVERVVSWQPGATAYRVSRVGSEILEEPYSPESIVSAL